MNCLACDVAEEHAHCPECLAILDDPTGFCPNVRALTQRMPRADAEADAETLRVVAISARETKTGRAAIAALRSASQNGYDACAWTRSDDPDVAAHHAIEAARAAFRAVPALRDEW